MEKYILASTSPRRREILKNIGIVFDVCSPLYEEVTENKSFSYEFIEMLARKKGESIKSIVDKNVFIISADTIVTLDNKILGKPKDYQEAYSMLELLSGNTHNVVTSVCIINTKNNELLVESETSEVTFNKLSKEDINSYINNFLPYDKAGSYGIQELPKNFIKEIKGEYDNIVGLPSKKLLSMLKRIKGDKNE